MSWPGPEQARMSHMLGKARAEGVCRGRRQVLAELRRYVDECRSPGAKEIRHGAEGALALIDETITYLGESDDIINPLRRCGYCQCKTNTKLRMCCNAGHAADIRNSK